MKKENLKKYLFSGYAIFIYYFLLACIWTRPVIFHLKSMIIGYHDAWQFIWNFWWIKTAIETGQNPFYTNYLHWPNGISLLFHTLSLPNSIIAYPIQSLIGITATYNILILLNLALTGLGIFLLANYFTKNKFSAFIAGYIVTFSAYMMAHSLGHLNLLSFGWVALFILYYWKLTKNESSWILPTVFLVLVAFTDWYYFFFTGIFIILHLIYVLIFDRKIFFKKKVLVNFAFLLLSSLLIISPYLGSMIYEKYTNSDFSFLGHNPLNNSIDLQTLVIPNFTSYFSNIFVTISGLWRSSFEGVGYLGYSVIILILFSLILVRKKEVYFFFFIFIIFLLLSLGPYLQIKGIIYHNIPLPYYLLDKNISFVALQGVPARFISFTFLFGAILASIMIARILKGKNLWKYFIITVVVGIIFVEYLPTKIITSKVSQIDFYSKLASDPNLYAVIDLNYDFDKVLYYQTIHHKPLLAGYTSRGTQKTTDFLNNTLVINNIFYSKDFDEYFDNKNAVELLKRYKIKFILISNQDKKRLEIVNRLNLLVVDRNTRGVVFKVY